MPKFPACTWQMNYGIVREMKIEFPEAKVNKR